jgi:hypothetical protein
MYVFLWVITLWCLLMCILLGVSGAFNYVQKLTARRRTPMQMQQRM